MAASLNRVFLIGNLTRDPELRYLPSGQAVTNFTVAVNRNYVSNTGEKKEDTSFIRVVVWARRAEVCNEYLRKGSPVFVEGRLQSRSWEAQDGTKRSTLEVVANNVQFLSRGGVRGGEVETIQLPEEPIASEETPGSPLKKEGPVEISKEELSPDEEVPF
ncbi:MAG: single-stranded DNA-binding protein [Candidatus Omnitrophica bacterium]|nr:single-stranded DNA-binding protein [Candidatus Omnitrophota bacterium]